MEIYIGGRQRVKPPQKVPPRRRASSWIRSESPEARRHRTRTWRGRITASVAEARGRPRWDAAAWLKPVPAEVPDPAPRSIAIDREGRAIAGSVLDAYLEARAERASTAT
jgi:hypothetical protein